MEGYHVMATHPQAMAFGGDGANMQYDVFGNWCRAITVGGNTSPQRGIYPDPEQIFAMRKGGADLAREGLRAVIGDKADIFCDAEVTDGYFNNLFPNFHPWGCFSRIVYRFRPYGDDPDRSIMEVLYLVPWPEGEEKPPAAPMHWLDEDEDFTLAPEMGGLARVINQDCYNLPKIQKGLKTKVDPYVYFSAYAEGRFATSTISTTSGSGARKHEPGRRGKRLSEAERGHPRQPLPVLPQPARGSAHRARARLRRLPHQPLRRHP